MISFSNRVLSIRQIIFYFQLYHSVNKLKVDIDDDIFTGRVF